MWTFHHFFVPQSAFLAISVQWSALHRKNLTTTYFSRKLESFPILWIAECGVSVCVADFMNF
jgi:hypothetical protein